MDRTRKKIKWWNRVLKNVFVSFGRKVIFLIFEDNELIWKIFFKDLSQSDIGKLIIILNHKLTLHLSSLIIQKYQCQYYT